MALVVFHTQEGILPSYTPMRPVSVSILMPLLTCLMQESHWKYVGYVSAYLGFILQDIKCNQLQRIETVTEI